MWQILESSEDIRYGHYIMLSEYIPKYMYSNCTYANTFQDAAW